MREIDKNKNQFIQREVDLTYLWKKIWGHRSRVLGVAGTILFIGIVYAFIIATPLYRSSTSLYQTTQEKGANSQLQVLAAQFGIGSLGSGGNFNIPDYVNSRRLRTSIIKKAWAMYNTKNDSVFLYDYWDIVRDDQYVKEELARIKLAKRISVFMDDETDLITIEVLMEHPQLAADIANFIGKQVSLYLTQEKQFQGRENRKFIDGRLNRAKEELKASEQAYKLFLEQNRAYANNPELVVEHNRLKRDLNIKEEIYLTLAKQRELALIEEVKDTPIINILDEGTRAIKKAQPKRLIILILFSLIGTILGVSSTFINLPKFKQ